MVKISNSFNRGIRMVPYGKVAAVKNRIMEELRITTRAAYSNRKNGYIAHTRQEAALIEQAFIEVGGIAPAEVFKIWGE